MRVHKNGHGDHVTQENHKSSEEKFLSLKVIMHITKTYNEHQRCKVESWQDTEDHNTNNTTLAGNEKPFKATTQANPHQLWGNAFATLEQLWSPDLLWTVSIHYSCKNNDTSSDCIDFFQASILHWSDVTVNLKIWITYNLINYKVGIYYK